MNATVIDDGLGKKRISVILDDDDSLTIQKISVHKVRPHQKLEWLLQGSLSSLIDQEKLCLAIINVFEQMQAAKISKAEENLILNIRYLAQMLLKVTS